MIIESFAKTFNKIKRIDENEIPKANDSKIIVDKAIDKMERDPNIPKVAEKIANDPKAMAELQKVLANLGVGMNEGIGINPEQIALAFVEKSKDVNENTGSGFWAGLLGGGALAHYIYSVPAVGSAIAGASSAAMTETMVGSIIGATLGVLAVYIYQKIKNGDNNTEINENSNDYYETLSQTLDAVRDYATKLGYELDEDVIFSKFGTGGISYETYKSANIPLLKNGEPILNKSGKEMNRAIHVSIYRMPSGKYELTMYKTY